MTRSVAIGKFLAFLMAAFSPAALAAGFLSAFDDVPLMDGLSTNQPLVFDSESMRFVEQFAAARKDAPIEVSQFRKFYRESLPSLGWKLVKNESKLLVFQREGEALSIEIKSENPLIARFSLAPLEK